MLRCNYLLFIRINPAGTDTAASFADLNLNHCIWERMAVGSTR